jgi:hypothetical protein
MGFVVNIAALGLDFPMYFCLLCQSFITPSALQSSSSYMMTEVLVDLVPVLPDE